MKTYDPLGNITTAGTSQATSTQVTAPTSYWKYDESSGVASDSTGSNTLTNNNTITYSAGKTNNASNLVAANSQWFSIANGTWSNLDPTTSFSLSFWLKLTSLPGSGEYSVISKTDGSAADYRVMIGGTAFGNNGIYALWTDNGSFASSQAHLGEYDGPANYFTSDDVGTWVHVTIVADATNQTVVAYKNGQPTTLTKRGSSNASSISQSAVRFDVGRIGTIKHLNGSLDEMRFWKNYKLNATEVLSLYNPQTGSTTYTYEGTGYANPDAPTQIATTGATTTFTYDSNGNMETGGIWTYGWDYRNRLTSAGNGSATTTFSYSHDDQRIKKTSGGVDTIYVNKFYEVFGATTTAYIWAGDTLVATIEGNGQATSTTYAHTDHLNSVSVTTDENGNVKSVKDFYPYGAERISTGDALDRTFLSRYADNELDLSYLTARYYSGDRGQFISQDPIHLAIGNPAQLRAISGLSQNYFLQDPQLLNSYAYARGNPLRYSDPDGKCVGPLVAVCIAGGVGAIGGVAFQGFNDYLTGEFGERTWKENLEAYSVAAVSGATVGAGVAGAAILAPIAGLGAGATAIAVGGTAGTLAAGTTYVGNRILGQPTDTRSLVIGSGLSALTAGTLRTLPQVVGRNPNFNTQAFYTGMHTQRQAAEELFSSSVNTFAQTVNRFSSQNYSSGGSGGGSSGLVSQLQSLVSALKGLVSSLSSKK